MSRPPYSISADGLDYGNRHGGGPHAEVDRIGFLHVVDGWNYAPAYTDPIARCSAA